MSLDVVTTPLRGIAPHFQRSINIAYDVEDTDFVASYIPTLNGAKALASILHNTLPNTSQRAHVLHAAYGSGKSLLGVVLNAFISRDAQYQSATSVVQNRLTRTFPEQATHVNDFLDRGTHLLPIILSGDEGYFTTALLRALSRALTQHNIPELRLNTSFYAALNIIDLWKRDYPEAFLQLRLKLSQKGLLPDELVNNLQALKSNALTLFTQLYPEITAGAHFDPYLGLNLESVFHATVEALHDFGYDGILILWDEFGRFLDSRIGDVFSEEAAHLQSFAEYCCRSGTSQVHLVLITHRLISGYASGFPVSYQKEWARIAERFVAHDISSDPTTTYRLVAEAFSIPNTDAWRDFTEMHRSQFNQLTALSFELSLFDELDDAFLRRQIIERAWPLHALSVYALPRLASRVAQNERTLFTFIAADEPGTVIEHLVQNKETNAWWLIRLDSVWDYFAEAIRSNVGAGGTHTVWLGAMYALSKVSKDDTQTQSLIKALAILLSVSEINIQSRTNLGRIVPTTDLLAWALDISPEEVTTQLETLVQRRAVIYRRSDGYWNFTRGSDVDLDIELNKAIDRYVYTPQQIRQILEQDFPLPYHLPRGYNQEKSIIRFFKGFYCWPNEIKNTSTEAFLKQGNTYTDGAIIYVLTTNVVEREQAIEAIQELKSGRLLYVIPDHPLPIVEQVRELFALRDMSNNAAFMQQDERLGSEIGFLIEDVQHRLTRSLKPFFEPHSSRATWWWYENACWSSEHLNEEMVSKLLSRLCYEWFSETPILNNELVNKHEPTSQQERASEKVIDALLQFPHDNLPPDLGVIGHGPDWLIVKTLLERTKLLRPIATGQNFLSKPASELSLAYIWDVVQDFLQTAIENEQDVGTLVDKLQSPPFGLRKGVLPILLATMMRFHLPALTIRHNKKIISPINGQTFIMLCKQPEQFTIELYPLDTRRLTLWAILEERVGHLLMAQEKTQQPFNVLSIGLLRWLQSLPRYCRDTSHLSHEAQQLRNFIRKAQRDSAQVLSHDLLELLDSENANIENEHTYRQMIAERLSNLMEEIATAYQTLLYSLDRFAGEMFSVDAVDGYSALRLWLASVEEEANTSLNSFRFSDKLSQRLVEVASQREFQQGESFWNLLSKAVLGIALNDWNDRSDENFRHKLLEAKERVEHEVFELSEDETSVKLSISLPTKDEQTYRFRQSGLSSQGQRILQNFKSTLEIAGRPLSPDEKRQIVLALLDYVMGESDSHDS